MKSTWIFIFIIAVILIIIYIKNQHIDVVYVKSDIDHEYYLVRDLGDKQQAANLLATIKANMLKLTEYLFTYRNTKEFAPFLPYIEQLHSRIKNVIIMESSSDSIYTSYSVNKGEQIIFCLRSRVHSNVMHKLNLMMYVVLHEMAHVACPEYGHTPLFKSIFAFITQTAISLGIYQKIDFDSNPEEYCGLTITDSII
ncbi:MAG: hypothetical protein Hyperionvirus20_9 [Hyperionvirus sp.]|uniref:WLM domain-containing protein n=1 Tax=Hyperionvirus sp. TaxID=2487770 RepID=A0A3G5AD83_9VIRU|nr:MAG: hypothetical protein Hyperionvirus20_9 [Hyperionvirus sp.]